METGSRHTSLILRQWSLSLSFVLFMSLSASLHPAALPLCLAFTASSHSFCFLLWFSFIHITLTSPPAPRLFPLFIQSNVFTSRSFYSRQPCRDASHLSPLFFHRLPVCRIIFLTSFSSSTSPYSCFITFDSLCLHLLFLAMFSFLCCKLCLQLYSKALMLKQTNTQTNKSLPDIFAIAHKL